MSRNQTHLQLGPPHWRLDSEDFTTSYASDLASSRKSVKPADDQMVTYDSHVYMNR